MSKNDEKRKKELEKEIRKLQQKLSQLEGDNDYLDEDERVVIIRDKDDIEYVQPLPALPVKPVKPTTPVIRISGSPKQPNVVRISELTEEQKEKVRQEKERIRKEREIMAKEILGMKKELQSKRLEFQKHRQEYDNYRRELREKERELRAKEKNLREQKYGSYTWDIDLDEDIEGMTSDLEARLGQYTKSILSSVADSLKSSMGIAIKGADDISYKFETIGDKSDKKAKEIGEKITKDIKVTIGPTIPEDKLEEFYEIGSQIVSAIGDPNRLKILKILEKEPMYQKQLSDITDIKGGTFSHHMKKLTDENVKFVTQEVVRRRYLLTTRGREALKLAEIQFMRYLEDQLNEDEDSDDEYNVKVK
ncbi:MAG: winged helix-turn-helix transcriptional regulator [Asgard group archaeon]|nr:winged helix-turn-helix transcriptional regulator [Asgard group archaeon]